MGAMVSAMVFPVPVLPQHLYQTDLLTRQDLVWLTTSRGENIPACYARASRRPGDGGGPNMTLLYSHGNGEDLMLQLQYVDALVDITGCDVFAYDYVGYSLSRCMGMEASEAGCIRSIDAAWRYCVDKLALPPECIIIYGRSIGSGPSVDLAARDAVPGSIISPRNVAGVVLQSPMASVAGAAFGGCQCATAAAYPLDIFRNSEKIGRIRKPVAIIHGTDDYVVSVGNGRELHSLLQNPFEPHWVRGHGHNDIPVDIVCEYIGDFLEALLEEAETTRIASDGQKTTRIAC